MKKINTVLVIICFAALSMNAQQSSYIQSIKKWYKETKSNIAYSKKHKLEGSLYCDIIERNINRVSFPAVGVFHIKQELWYSTHPDNLDNPAEGLEMVIVNCERASLKYYEEYLFHNGQLVFSFYKEGDLELRYYFKNKKLIKKLEGSEYDNMYAMSEKSALQNAEVYIKQYTTTFGENED